MKLENHPCFNADACADHGRVHLPVAPACNIQCNFCDRKFDCVNESRPGVSSALLTPMQALTYLKAIERHKQNIAVVGIAGPGDPFANPQRTLKTLALVRRHDDQKLLCVASNGLNVAPYVAQLKQLAVSHVSITVSAVDPLIGAKIYSWVRWQKRTRPAAEGARIILEQQMRAITALKAAGIIVKVNCILLPGINEDHVDAIATRMAALKVDLFNLIPYHPTPGANLAHLTEPSPGTVARLRRRLNAHLPQMSHCRRCRADATGLLGEPPDTDAMQTMQACAALPTIEPAPQTTEASQRIYAAVASLEGVLINQHLGEAHRLMIYRWENGRAELADTRPAPEPGGGQRRWRQLAAILNDCRVLMVSGIGDTPEQILTADGLQVLSLEGMIEEAVPAYFKGLTLNHMIKRRRTACGESCGGMGGGCG